MLEQACVGTASLIDDESVWRELHRIARAVARDPAPPGGTRIRTQVHPAERDDVRYHVRGDQVRHAGEQIAVVLVAIESIATPPPAQFPDASEIRLRCGLTSRQAEVALLLADRKTSKEIARDLKISRHTARRHVEAVLLKLGIHCRREVRAVLQDCRRVGAQPDRDRRRGPAPAARPQRRTPPTLRPAATGSLRSA